MAQKNRVHSQTYRAEIVSTGSSFLKCLTCSTSSSSTAQRRASVVFDSDCREGIWRYVLTYNNGHPHGPVLGHHYLASSTCVSSTNEDTIITIEPWRSAAFLVIRDLMVNRNAFRPDLSRPVVICVVQLWWRPDANNLPISAKWPTWLSDSGNMYRLRRLRGSLQKRLGNAFVSASVKPVRTPAARSGGTRPRNAS